MGTRPKDRTAVNGRAGILVVSAGVRISVVSFGFAGGRIADIYVVSNPDKLRHLTVSR
jgi:hypothetical protein